jgi:hypothetical protein
VVNLSGFAIDPEDKPICKQEKRWIDSSDLTTYFTGGEVCGSIGT